MKKLYNNLLTLCNEDNKFFYSDHTSSLGNTYRIFSYHIANYNDWLKPNALECRGIMFEMDNETPKRLAARPMEKFFNLNENPITMDLDLSKIAHYEVKEDGSLISSFMDGEDLSFKSKGSLRSDQALAAHRVINLPRYDMFKRRIQELAEAGYTVNMEYVGPKNRIVLPYETEDLIILNVRDNETGEYALYTDMMQDVAVNQFIVEAYEAPEDVERWVKETRESQGIEGYVVAMEDGKRFKLKTDWYVALHHTKDSINSNRRLMYACIEECTDDLRQLFEDDQQAIDKIVVFEQSYANALIGILNDVQSVHSQLKACDRKDFAITGRQMLQDQGTFSILMGCYGIYCYDTTVTRTKEYIKKNWKQFIPREYKDDSTND